MNYQLIYNRLIEHRLNNSPTGYSERHHIIPRSLGGSNDKSNLVRLTAREHFVCHLLLLKLQKKNSNAYHKMLRAFIMMHCSSDLQQRYMPSRTYEKLRIEFSELQKISSAGENGSQFGTRWVSDPTTGNSFKISKDSSLPDGMIFGRNKKFVACTICGKNHVRASKFCSNECKKKNIKLGNYTVFTKEKEDQFLADYQQTKSMNQSLKNIGFKHGAVSAYHAWAKDLLSRSSLIGKAPYF